MDSKKVAIAASLTDDIVVEILSRVPLKSFCRFKCVCKAWLAFSSDPHYHQKLPKLPTGILHQNRYRSDIQLISMSGNDEEIDGTLRFLPKHNQLELMDCCNGLVLCQYRSIYTCEDSCRLIVCNPATREWKGLRVHNTHGHPYQRSCHTAFLAFDPSWSAQFFVLNFRVNINDTRPNVTQKLEVFFSDLSRWLVDDAWSFNLMILVNRRHKFIGGVFYVQTITGDILVVEGLDGMSYGMAPYHHILKLPGGCLDGCFGQSLGVLQYAFPEEGGRTIAVFSLDTYDPCRWFLKHRICIGDVFVRDNILSNGEYRSWFCPYRIVALGLETEVILVFDKEPKKLLSYDINMGKLSEIKDGHLECTWDCTYYVACYWKLRGLSRN